jgi:hypothetical protein
MRSADCHPLLAVSERYIFEACPNISPGLLPELRQIMDSFISGILTMQRASAIFLEKAGTSLPVNRIAAIMHVPENPMHSQQFPEFSFTPNMHPRKKTHPWTKYEDQRLLCAINRFGLKDWASVSLFVGNQRTRAQCSQRWSRALDPRISKVLWTQDEEQRLRSLVEMHGSRAWARISAELGNRSDAQCRYHYQQMLKELQVSRQLAAIPTKISTSNSEPTKARWQELTMISISKLVGTGIPPKKPLLPPIEDLISRTAHAKN